jgi:hypothetical protein
MAHIASDFFSHRDYSSHRFDIDIRFWRVPLGTGDRIYGGGGISLILLIVLVLLLLKVI